MQSHNVVELKCCITFFSVDTIDIYFVYKKVGDINKVWLVGDINKVWLQGDINKVWLEGLSLSSVFNIFKRLILGRISPRYVYLSLFARAYFH